MRVLGLGHACRKLLLRQQHITRVWYHPTPSQIPVDAAGKSNVELSDYHLQQGPATAIRSLQQNKVLNTPTL